MIHRVLYLLLAVLLALSPPRWQKRRPTCLFRC